MSDADSLRHRHPVDAAGYVMIWNVVMRDVRLSPCARLLYGLLCDFERGGGCFPRQETLARLLGKEEKPCTIRSVFNYLAELKEHGLLSIRRRGQGRSNEYILEDVREIYGTEKIDRKPVSTQHDRNLVSTLDRKPDSGPLKQTKRKQKEEKTLNVEADVNFVASQAQPIAAPEYQPSNSRSTILDQLVKAVVNELGDIGSEKRHRQLLDICERNGLDELAKQALLATRRRLAQEQEQGVLEKPGAYYQKILIGLLEDHQVFVPPAGSKDEQAEVKRLARASLGI